MTVTVDAATREARAAAARASRVAASRRRRGRRPRRGLRRPGAALLACAALLLPGLVWTASRGWMVREHLTAAAGLVRTLNGQLRGGDLDAAARTLSQLQVHADAARAYADDPLWRGAGHTPGLGDDVRAVSAVSRTVDELANVGLPALLRSIGQVRWERFAPVGGRLPLTPLARIAPDLATADAAFAAGRSRIAAVDRRGLVGPVGAAVAQLGAELATASRDLGTAARAAALIPALAGASGPRTFLLVFQNLAEVRATGGLPGAYAVVEADHGRLRVRHQGSASGLRPFPRPVLPLDPAQQALYSDRFGTYPADVNLTPDFPTAAATLREMYRRRTGRTVDGVLATDPVALSYVLRVQGPVPVPGGPTLTGATAVRTLLSDTYRRVVSPTTQDRYFAAAARATFAALTGRAARPVALVRALGRAAGERRLLVWSADPAEQRRLEETVLGGRLPADDGREPTVGVFLNDGSGAKLGYYLRQRAALDTRPCVAGRREYALRVRLSSLAPAAGLPKAVTGLALAGDPFTLRTNVVVLAPTGGSLVTMRLDGRPVPYGAGSDRGRRAGSLLVDLPPGGSADLEVVVRAGTAVSAFRHVPRLWVTPRVTDWSLSTQSTDACPPGQ
ncbi:hypothetical protein GCM10010124_23400 [Pilimelia terevasa]|uniref:DUF4012 domain-containing protein n=1 Tax=Pilimelia terevasa TaxID=53372 RepID=A0A8J3BL09_9ACTN|nr:DUF4012 domain-containing protein [Pilimelia terevasa]GGK29971.1 hypothetical protein GCM10010124_23400 [Pilimelia terevasa]